MSSDKKPAKETRKASKPDVERPGKSAPSGTSKPVIVTNRPILKDPMMVEADTSNEDEEQENLAHSSGPKLQPLEEPKEQPTKPDKKEDKQPTKEAPQAPEAQNTEPPEEKPEKEVAEQPGRDAAVEELINSRKYELPINAVEKRKAKHFVVLGVLLAVLLALAWADIALDAGLVHINGIQPVTHFFSN